MSDNLEALKQPDDKGLAESRLHPACSASFGALCERLIEEGENYLYPEISRTRSTDWMAYIFSHHDPDRRENLAEGGGATMEDACAACVSDYYRRRETAARKRELMKDPKVREALELFGVQNE